METTGEETISNLALLKEAKRGRSGNSDYATYAVAVGRPCLVRVALTKIMNICCLYRTLQDIRGLCPFRILRILTLSTVKLKCRLVLRNNGFAASAAVAAHSR